MDQTTLKAYLELQLQSRGYPTVNKKGFLYAEGQIPVLLVAHLDTVHRQKAEIICFSENNRFVMSPQGIGGDDRCGVYMIMEILKVLPCHILFCEDEEVGGRGAKAFAKSNIFPAVNYIIELDRRGSNDAVFYHCHNPEFTEFVLGFGFTEKGGTFSDISVIAPHLKTAAVNISAGYFNEHREHEYIDMLAVEYNIERIIDMLKTETEHFDYITGSDYEKQISMFGYWGWIPMEQRNTEQKSVRKLLMTIPDSAHIIYLLL